MTPNSRTYLNRFISPDSIVPSYANPQSLNRFSYTQNDPINFNDPTGNCQRGKSDYLYKQCEKKLAAINLQGVIQAQLQAQAQYITSLHHLLEEMNGGIDVMGGESKPLSLTVPDVANSPESGGGRCQQCIITGGAIIIATGVLELIFGGATIYGVSQAGPVGLVFLPADVITLNFLLVGIELVVQGQNRNAEDINIDYLPLIPTSDHLANPAIWK